VAKFTNLMGQMNHMQEQIDTLRLHVEFLASCILDEIEREEETMNKTAVTKATEQCGCIYRVNPASPDYVQCGQCGGWRKVTRFGD